jgi:O-antigen ligase
MHGIGIERGGRRPVAAFLVLIMYPFSLCILRPFPFRTVLFGYCLVAAAAWPFLISCAARRRGGDGNAPGSLGRIASSPASLAMGILLLLGVAGSSQPRVSAVAGFLALAVFWTFSMLREMVRDPKAARLAWILSLGWVSLLIVLQLANAVSSWTTNSAFRVPDFVGAVPNERNNAHLDGFLLAILLAFPTAGLLRAGRRSEKAAFGGFLVLTLFSLVTTYSRSAFFAAAAVLLVMPVLAKRYRWLIVQLAAFGVVLLAIPHATERIRQSVADEVYDPFGSRFAQWRVALDLSREHPLVGTGLGTFSRESPPHFNEPLERGPVWPHNLYLTILTDLGAPALVLFLFFSGRGLSRSVRAFSNRVSDMPDQKRLHLALLGAVVGFLAFGMWDL